MLSPSDLFGVKVSCGYIWLAKHLFPYCEREQCELFSLGHGNLKWESPKFMKLNQELLGRKQSAPVCVFLKTASKIRNWLVYLEFNPKKQGEGAIGKQLDVSHGTKSLGSQCLRYPWGTSQHVPQECLPSLGDIGVFSLIITEDFLWVGNYTPVPPPTPVILFCSCRPFYIRNNLRSPGSSPEAKSK